MRKILTVAFLALSLPAQAGIVDGHKLYDACIDDQSVLVHGYVLGVVDELARPRLARGKDGQLVTTKPDVCLPPGDNIKLSVDLSCQLLHDRPDMRDQDANVLVHTALYSAFPCP